MGKTPGELLHYLDAMGIKTYARRGPSGVDAPPLEDAAPPKVKTPAETQAEPAPPEDGPLARDWKILAAEVAQCEKCVLHKTRKNTVFGVGDRGASWMFIGEGPGAEEDARGEPFVGRAGKLLDKMLAAIGFARGQVYIANIVKCRPPDNRNPRPEEAETCMAYLRRQIALVKPDIIVCLGGVAMKEVLDTEAAVGKMRGQVHYYSESEPPTPVVVTYHPAYLLRSPDQKKSSWEDLQFACRTIGHELPERAGRQPMGRAE